MAFNSFAFIVFYVPLTFAVYFVLNGRALKGTAKGWLVLASLFLYGCWNFVYVPFLLGSLLFNYFIGLSLIHKQEQQRLFRWMLPVGVTGNLLLLAYFKYMDFFVANINAALSLHLRLLHIALPLGISFLTFTQIAYLVDTARGAARERSLINYALFVTFFPRLLVGPIVRHQEMMPQLDDPGARSMNAKHIAQGLTLFFLGLFKKVIIADRLSAWANPGFDTAVSLSFLEAWTTSLSYTLQLYFDFSGYTDMALGASLLFNIKLPANFNSPYRSLTIQEFWRRWHMTLGRFVRDYIYIPLGGSRVSQPRVVLNILSTFFLVGLWHGAGWTFVAWGLLHGSALVIFRGWKRVPFRLPRFLSWFITFNFVNAAWVFFRARTFSDAFRVLKGMAGLTGVVLPESLSAFLPALSGYGIRFGEVLPTIRWDDRTALCLATSGLLALFFRNSGEIVERYRPAWRTVVALSAVMIYALLNLNRTNEFIYFRF